jgi:hypothetical protein
MVKKVAKKKIQIRSACNAGIKEEDNSKMKTEQQEFSLEQLMPIKFSQSTRKDPVQFFRASSCPRWRTILSKLNPRNRS